MTPKDHWGGVAAQIMYMVSPELQDELGLRYEHQWLQEFGLTYYGCCAPLHDRVHILRSIPNLRKISMSPWAHVDEMVQTVGRDLVLSYKPNPEILARDTWEPERARATIAACLDTALQRRDDHERHQHGALRTAAAVAVGGCGHAGSSPCR
mgnify:CR=1 FL=1